MIVYDNAPVGRRGLCCLWRGSVIPTALACALPSGIAAVILLWLYEDVEKGDDEFGGNTLNPSQLWSAMVASLAFLIGFRTNKAYQRFWDGTTLLNQMWGEWFDAASCLFAFSHLARKTKRAEVTDFRNTLIRLMSLIHASALEEISLSTDSSDGYDCLDIGGLDLDSLRWLKECKFNKELGFNRVEVIIHMIQNLIVENQDIGVLKIPPPILSRVFQTLSRGQVNLANCKKIVFTLFPFPYAQLITCLLMIFSALSPLAMASINTEKHWAFLFTVVPVFGLVALNLVACELEMPFGKDHNDLPLDDFQEHMNLSMLMLICDESDLVPHINKFAGTDHHTIKANVNTQRPKDVIPILEGKGLGEEKKQGKEEQEAPVPVPPPVAKQLLGKTDQNDPVPPEKAAKDCLLPFEISIGATSQPLSSNPPEAAPGALPQPSNVLATLSDPKLEALNGAFDDLKANTSGLSSQLGRSMNSFQDLISTLSAFNSQLCQSSEAMVAFSNKEPQPTKMPEAKTWWSGTGLSCSP